MCDVASTYPGGKIHKERETEKERKREREREREIAVMIYLCKAIILLLDLHLYSKYNKRQITFHTFYLGIRSYRLQSQNYVSNFIYEYNFAFNFHHAHKIVIFCNFGFCEKLIDFLFKCTFAKNENALTICYTTGKNLIRFLYKPLQKYSLVNKK